MPIFRLNSHTLHTLTDVVFTFSLLDSTARLRRSMKFEIMLIDGVFKTVNQ